MAAVTPTSFVSWGEFVRIRNSQDEQLGREFAGMSQKFRQVDQRFDQVDEKFHQIDQRFDQLEHRFDEKFHQIDQRFDQVDEKLHQIDQRFDHLELENKRMAAHSKNSSLKNPTLRIVPIPAYDQTRGIIYPDPTKFPRHAKDFYSLRYPSSPRHQMMLSYLVGFYDIQLAAPEGSDHEVQDGNDDAKPDDDDTSVEERFVELLEGILGLNEDNFIRFRERAAELRLHPSWWAAKRSQPPVQDAKEAEPRRPKLELRPHVPPKEPPKDESWSEDNAGLGWRVGPRSTPSSKRRIVRLTEDENAVGEPVGEPAIQPTMPAAPSSGDSNSTRPFTNPRQP